MRSLAKIHADTLRLVLGLGGRERHLPTFGYSTQEGFPHVEVSSDQYHYVTAERGQEFSRQSTTNYQELLYWIFSDVTQKMAFAPDADLGQPGQVEYWRIAYRKQIELIGRINSDFAPRLAADIDRRLASSNLTLVER
jgi:Immunity protein 63